jgi:hypothetical protein
VCERKARPARVHGVEDALVVGVARRLVAARGRVPEDDEREGVRGDHLPARRAAHPLGELLRQPDVVAHPLGEPLRAEGADHHPQLERAEAAPELRAVVHQVDGRVLLARHEVLGDEREGAAQHVGRRV